MENLFISAGEMKVCKNGEVLRTVLGSCVSVCIFDPILKIGGMNHYLLPDPSSGHNTYAENPLMFGTLAIPALLKEFKKLGSHPQNLIVKVIGGANLESNTLTPVHIENVRVALDAIRNFGLKVAARSTGGTLGRKVEFNTGTGELQYISLNRIIQPSPTVIPAFSKNCIDYGLILIGASTGGTEAIRTVLTALPKQIPPILIAQHMPAQFTKSFSERLNELCSFEVHEAIDGEEIRPGQVYLGPGGRHLEISEKNQKSFIRLVTHPETALFKPSVDSLFYSAARTNIARIGAVLLTGMGTDGAQGLLSLKKKNAVTIVQDEETSVVFGMPKSAIEIGAAQWIVSLSEISTTLVTQMNLKEKKNGPKF